MGRKVKEEGHQIAPFLLKCYEMVDDESTDALISWGTSLDSFIIWNETEFSTHLLPKYFKHNTFSSFIRQLNIYGFRKIETDRWEFANDYFIKGENHLLKNIIRRKHSQGSVQPKASEQKDNQEKTNVVLWREVESLKTDKNMLMQELVTLRQHQQTSKSKLLLLREQLKGMEKNQQQMLSFIVMAMQSPGFLVQLLQPKENNWRVAESGKNILEEVIEDQETVPSDGMIVRYQPPPTDEFCEPFCMPSSDSENLLELDLSSDEVKDLFMNIDVMLGTLDGEFPSSENHGPLVLPDLPHEDDMMEELLLSNPLPENDSSAKLDNEDLVNAGMEMESTFSKPCLKVSDQFENLTEGMEEYQKSMELLVLETQLNNSHNMKTLTN